LSGGGTIAQRSAFFEEAAGFSDFLVVDTDDGSFVLSTSGTTIERELFAERVDTRALALTRTIATLRRLGHAEVIDGSLIEAGANIGTVTVPAVLHHGFSGAVCFEPEPRSHLLLRMNCTWNGIADVTEIHPVALSSGDGEIDLVYEHERSTGYRLRSPGPTQHLAVARTSVDGLTRDGRLDLSHTSMLWIGAQGHELDVLRGASELIRRGVPIVLEDARELVADEALLDEALSLLEGTYAQFARLDSVQPGSEEGPKRFRRSVLLDSASLPQLGSSDPAHPTALLLLADA
jgi:FkbM family methyltransferase